MILSKSRVKTLEAVNLLVGSCICIGSDRDDQYPTVKNAKIKSITNTNINDTTYSQILVDNGGTAISTTTSYKIHTAPYWSGWNDDVLGNDGSKISYTSGKEPGLIQKTEFMISAYLIVADELIQCINSYNGNTPYSYTLYTCTD